MTDPYLEGFDAAEEYFILGIKPAGPRCPYDRSLFFMSGSQANPKYDGWWDGFSDRYAFLLSESEPISEKEKQLKEKYNVRFI